MYMQFFKMVWVIRKKSQSDSESLLWLEYVGGKSISSER